MKRSALFTQSRIGTTMRTSLMVLAVAVAAACGGDAAKSDDKGGEAQEEAKLSLIHI